MNNLKVKERPTKHIPFYVINGAMYGRGEFEPYDVMPYLINEYKDIKKSKRRQANSPLPTTDKEWQEFVKRWAQYQFWSRCEYEIILSSWPPLSDEEGKKIDVYDQIIMNLPIVAEILKRNVTT